MEHDAAGGPSPKCQPARVLVLEDEPEMAATFGRILTSAGYRSVAATEAGRALALLESERPDLLLTDIRMPGSGGLELLGKAHHIDRTVPVIVVASFATIESAVDAIKLGAFDYVPKPFSADHLLVVIQRALRQRRLELENENGDGQLEQTLTFANIVGRSPAMMKVFDLVRRAARSEANILVLGESGTGKELIARAVHANSPRAGRAFIPVDCASIPEPLLESELFGHEKGAFTGAVSAKPGLLELANGGTVFLDEIAELPLSLQGKLLRAIQERQFRRVGATGLSAVDVRFVSATTSDLRDAVVRRRFREELYYRVNVIEIRVPPLRERGGDIGLLAQALLEKYREGRVLRLDEETLSRLETYWWPGNVRELQNVIERACVLADSDVVTPDNLPDTVRHGVSVEAATRTTATLLDHHRSGTPLPLKEAKQRWMDVLEASYVKNMLVGNAGNVSAAAKAAGIDRKTFHRLLRKYRLHAAERSRLNRLQEDVA